MKPFIKFVPLAGVVLFIGLLILNGYERDTVMATPVLDRYSNLLWLGLGLTVILSITSLLSKQLNISLLALLTTGLVSGFVLSEKPNFDNYRLTNGVKTNVSQVSWKQLSDWKAQDQTTLVFIGRDNCEYCQEFKKILDSATYKTGVNVVYYNTLPDREKEWFTDAMAKYGVTQVPTLLSVGYGKVKNFQATELDPIMTSSDKLEKFLTDSDKWKIQ